jgi:hypothetical protein
MDDPAIELGRLSVDGRQTLDDVGQFGDVMAADRRGAPPLGPIAGHDPDPDALHTPLIRRPSVAHTDGGRESAKTTSRAPRSSAHPRPVRIG